MIKLYIDWVSQPSRAVKIIFDLLKVPHEVNALKIQFDEHKSPAFTAINPLQQLPTITDGDFKLAESHAIMKYIIRSRNIQTSLYPLLNIRKQAQIDQYLDYHHTNTRKCVSLYHSILISPIKKEIVIPEVLEKEKQDVKKCLTHFDQYLLKNNDYICGDELTLADVSAFCEVIQLDMIKYDFAQFPRLNEWLNRVYKVPEVQTAHTVALKIIKNKNPDSQFLKK